MHQHVHFTYIVTACTCHIHCHGMYMSHTLSHKLSCTCHINCYVHVMYMSHTLSCTYICNDDSKSLLCNRISIVLHLIHLMHETNIMKISVICSFSWHMNRRYPVIVYQTSWRMHSLQSRFHQTDIDHYFISRVRGIPIKCSDFEMVQGCVAPLKNS